MSKENENIPKSEDQKRAERDAHRDPLSGRAGAHPVGTGVGAAGGVAAGAAAGAAVGSAAGPIGTVVGAAVGGVAGAIGSGLAGKAIAESVDPTVEHSFWRSKYASRPYVKPGTTYEDYAPAYQLGWEHHEQHAGKTFETVEADLQREWDQVRGKSQLAWDNARFAARDAWNRMHDHNEKVRSQLDRDLEARDPEALEDQDAQDNA